MLRRFFIACTAIFLIACGGGGDDVNLSGNWSGSATALTGGSGTVNVTVSLSQNGSNLVGTFSSTSGNSGQLTGTVSGNSVSIDAKPSNPNNCPAKWVLQYTDNTLTGTTALYNCTVSVSSNITLKR